MDSTSNTLSALPVPYKITTEHTHWPAEPLGMTTDGYEPETASADCMHMCVRSMLNSVKDSNNILCNLLKSDKICDTIRLGLEGSNICKTRATADNMQPNALRFGQTNGAELETNS